MIHVIRLIIPKNWIPVNFHHHLKSYVEEEEEEEEEEQKVGTVRRLSFQGKWRAKD